MNNYRSSVSIIVSLFCIVSCYTRTGSRTQKLTSSITQLKMLTNLKEMQWPRLHINSMIKNFNLKDQYHQNELQYKLTLLPHLVCVCVYIYRFQQMAQNKCARWRWTEISMVTATKQILAQWPKFKILRTFTIFLEIFIKIWLVAMESPKSPVAHANHLWIAVFCSLV